MKILLLERLANLIFVLLNKDDYLQKLNTILEDKSKFQKIDKNPINLFVKKKKNKRMTLYLL